MATLCGITLALVAVVFLVLHVRLSQFAFDDAYIHFRVARNLLDLGTPYFNASEMVKVSTSSGWTVFIAVLLAFSRLVGIEGNFNFLVSLVNALLTLAGLLLYTRIIEKVPDHQWGNFARLFFQITYLALLAGASIGLMEIPLALLLAGLGIYDILDSKLRGFFWLGLASYIRLELLILPATAGIYLIHQNRSNVWKILLYAALGILPFLVYDLFFFHTVIPHSIVAKSAVYSIASLTPFTRGLLLAFPIVVSENQWIYFIGAFILLLGILFSTAVTLLFGQKSIAKNWILIFDIWAVAVFAIYIAGHTLVFEWYTPLYTVPMLLTVTLCADKRSFPRNGLSTGIQFLLFVISLVVLVQFSIAALWDTGKYLQFESGSRVKTYLAVGEHLSTEYPGAVLLSSEIGGLGYSFPGQVLDAAGLASTDALDFHPMRIPEERIRGDLGAIPPLYVEKHLPELIVSFDQFAQALLASNVTDQYNMILIPAYLPEDARNAKKETIWGDKFLRVYIRKDLPLSKELLRLE